MCVLSAVLPDRSVPETLLSRSPTASFSAPVILSLLQVCADSSEHPDKKSWVTTSYHQPKKDSHFKEHVIQDDNAVVLFGKPRTEEL